MAAAPVGERVLVFDGVSLSIAIAACLSFQGIVNHSRQHVSCLWMKWLIHRGAAGEGIAQAQREAHRAVAV